jgi:hypothetical protein
MALGNKTLDDLLGPISQQLNHTGVPESVEVPEWEFRAGDRIVALGDHKQIAALKDAAKAFKAQFAEMIGAAQDALDAVKIL